MAQAQGLALANVGEVGQVGDTSDQFQVLLPAPPPEGVLQLECDVEVVLNGGLAASGHQHQAFDTRPDGLLDHVLDDRRIH